MVIKNMYSSNTSRAVGYGDPARYGCSIWVDGKDLASLFLKLNDAIFPALSI